MNIHENVLRLHKLVYCSRICFDRMPSIGLFLNVVYTPQAGCSPLRIAVFSSRQRVELITRHTVQNLNYELQYRIMRFTLGLDRSWMVMARSYFGMRGVYITISLDPRRFVNLWATHQISLKPKVDQTPEAAKSAYDCYSAGTVHSRSTIDMFWGISRNP